MRFLVNILAFIGRHGPVAFAISLVLGLALPQLAALARPLLPVTIFLFVTMNIFRADFSAVQRVVSAPATLGLTLLWSVICQPLVIGLGLWLVGRDALEPGLLLALALYGAAPPLVAVPTYAAMLGFPAAFSLTILILGTALSPLLSPIVAGWIAGASVPIDRLALAIRLVWLLGGAIFAGILVRFLVGRERIAAARSALDGFSVVVFFLFAVAAMDGVMNKIVNQAGTVLAFTSLAFLICIIGMAATWAALYRLGRLESFPLGIGTGFRNMGLLIAVLPAVPKETFLFFSLMQIPIYCAPQLLKLLVPFFRLPAVKVAPSGDG